MHAAEEAARHVGPSVSETAAAAASLAAALTSDQVVVEKAGGGRAGRAARRVRGFADARGARAATPFSLEGLLRDATGDIEKLAADCVARA